VTLCTKLRPLVRQPTLSSLLFSSAPPLQRGVRSPRRWLMWSSSPPLASRLTVGGEDRGSAAVGGWSFGSCSFNSLGLGFCSASARRWQRRGPRISTLKLLLASVVLCSGVIGELVEVCLGVSGCCASSSGKSVASFASKAEGRLCCLLWLEGERFELVVPSMPAHRWQALIQGQGCLRCVPDRCLFDDVFILFLGWVSTAAQVKALVRWGSS
jgi:hypothetical protein